MRCRRTRRGFTLVEIIVVIAILSMVVFVSVGMFQGMYRMSSLRAATQEVHEYFATAQGQTLASESDQVYGVHVSTTSVTLFQGATYSTSSVTNLVYRFEGGVTATGTLVRNNPTIIFSRLTGVSSASGTILLRDSVGRSTTSVMIHTSGLVEYGS